MTKLSIVIVSYNAATQLRSCLDDVAELRDVHSGVEIAVIDNASEAEARRVIVDHQAIDVRLFNDTNVGFAAACNRAASKTVGNYILFLNPDVRLHPGSVVSALSELESDPKIGVLGGRSQHSDGSLDPMSCWGRPTLWSAFTFAIGLSTLFAGRNSVNPEGMGGWLRDDSRQVGVVTGCFLLIPRVVWDMLGGFDEQFFMYGEDADLTMRAAHAGFAPRIDPAALYVHEGGASSSSSRRRELWLYRGKVSLYKKHYSRAASELAIRLLEVGVLVRATGSRVTMRGRKYRDLWDDRQDWRQGWRSQAS